MDFTQNTYLKLLLVLQNQNYIFQPFREFLKAPKEKTIILRHDVDLLPENSLKFAQMQANLSIKGTYYFRVVPESWDEYIISKIADLGHEVGYHYETMDTANGDVDKAWDLFRSNLDELRKLSDISTICMHGSPRSKYDNKQLWLKYDYKTLGLIGEPYFDIDFNQVFYLTDTGRCWDGWKVSVRDKVQQQEQWVKQGLVFHSTDDIIIASESGKLPDKIAFTFHPQRWHEDNWPWLKEFVSQNIKNQVKRVLIR